MIMESPQNKLPEDKIFEKRRKFPRSMMNIPLTVTGAPGERFEATLYDLSPDGAQIRYPIENGIHLFLSKNTPIKDIKSLKCILQFNLPYKDMALKVKINAHPVYLRSISEDTLAVGMLFADDEMAENKKVSDFLFYQLELSFWDLEMQQESTTKTKPVKKIKRNKTKSDHHEKKTHPSFDPEELISNTGRTRTDMELLKQELTRIMDSLEVIQETTRHNDERIYILEQKLIK